MTTMAQIQEITRKLEAASRTAEVIRNRYAAHFQLHTAACLNRDAKEMTERRDELHTILDALLDNGESLQRYVDELHNLSRGA